MTFDELKNALESRGFDIDQAAQRPPAALDRLLPPAPEPELSWLARRAATEIAVDPDLRFIRFQDTVFPTPAPDSPGRHGAFHGRLRVETLARPRSRSQGRPAC